MKIAFYHDDDNGLNHTEILNKASSGTVMSMLNLIVGLEKIGNNVTVLSKAEEGIFDNVNYNKINNRKDLKFWYQRNEVDVLIAVGKAGRDLEYIANIKKSKIIYWHHNYLNIKSIVNLTNDGFIDEIVCVSPHHMSSLYKYRVFKKVTYIRNAIIFDSISKFKVKNTQRNGLAYVGNISKEKGFDSVINTYHNYRESGGTENLHVYGSNSLYFNDNGNKILNENSFDCETNILIDKYLKKNNILFHGKVSRVTLYKELNERKLLLCGFNKSGGAETAGMGMVEAQYFGCSVLTLNRGGQPDSVYNKKNILEVNEIDKSSYIKKLVTSEMYNVQDELDKWLKSKYDYMEITKQWSELLDGNKVKIKHASAIIARCKVFFKMSSF
ncbi:glycosyltransferase [Vibrio splendidus]|uniref:glycosyltransferase n=1 Tax=Vibrio splendidus TaxID=29497 RepID=UPI000C844887|nr:glycosyltransferase [Vibrio splendidus]PMJ32651.1 hypothetical protein BCU26_09615 [Vibrio splendidus]